MKDEETQRRHDLRTEYQAISSYFGTVVTFRFTLLGFYLAAVGVIYSRVVTIGYRREKFILILLTFCTYLIELRNRSLYWNLACRGESIEAIWWGELPKNGGDDHICKPYFNHMMHPVPKDFPKFFGLTLRPLQIRHSTGINLLFMGIAAYAFRMELRWMVRLVVPCFGGVLNWLEWI